AGWQAPPPDRQAQRRQRRMAQAKRHRINERNAAVRKAHGLRKSIKRRWRPLPGLPEYEVSDSGEVRGARSNQLINKKHHAAIWRKMLSAQKAARSEGKMQ